MIRFHFGEVALSALFRVAQIALIGVTPFTFALYEIMFELNTLFQHSNVRLPFAFERWLNALIVTPRMHGIHHSDVRRENQSNFSVVFSIWDRLHRTLRLNVAQSRIAIGTVKKESEPEAKMAIVSESPNRVSAVFILTNYDLRFTYDGRAASLRPQLSRAYAAFDNKYREMAASGLMFNSISLYNLFLNSPTDVRFEAKGIKKVKGRDAYVVEITRPKADAMRAYFDAETYMWVRTDYGMAHISKEAGAFTNESVYHTADELSVDFYIETSDFRDVDGVRLPFKFEVLLTTPIVREKSSGTIAGTITEYRHNEMIDPKMFQ